MGSTNELTANESGVSTAERFFEKLGLVFSRVKDAIIMDLSEGLPENVESWDDVEKFVNAVVKKIGYDLSGASKSNKAYNLFMSIIDTSVATSEMVVAFVDNSSKQKDLESAIQNLIKGAQSGTGELGGLKEIIDLVKKLIDLFKDLSDIEWNEIAKEIQGFGNFIENNYFTEKFAKRIVDYVLITFLKNVREVFADDLENLLVNASEEISKTLKNTLNDLGIDVSKFEELQGYLKNYKSLLNNVEKALKQKNIGNAAKAIENAAQGLVSTQSLNLGGSVGDAVNNFVNLTEDQLESYKKILRQRINDILEQIAPGYNATAKVLDRVCAVLEFLGVIGEKKVDLVKLATENAGISANLPSIEIPAFDWNVFEKIFTNPKDYLSTAFPLENYDDAEKIIIKVMNLVRAFNKDFPQIQSVKQFIWDLIVIVKNKIDELETAANDAYRELVNQLKSVKEFFLDLLKICESMLIETKKTLIQAFNDCQDEVKGILKNLNEEIGEIQNKLNKIKIDETFEAVVVDTLKDAVKENVSEFYDESKIETVFKDSKNEIEKFKKDTIDNFERNIVTGIKGEVTKAWNNGFKGLVKDIKTAFEEQTKKIPTDCKELKNFGKESVNKLLQGQIPDNPFSDIDLHVYYKIFVKKLACFSDLKDIDSCFDTFGGTVKTNLESHIKAICKKIDSVDVSEAKLKTLAEDIFKGWLSKIQSKFFELILKPFIDEIKDIIYEWATENVLKTALIEVRRLIDSKELLDDWNECKNDLEQYFGDVDSKALTDVVMGILELSKEHEPDSWKTWKNALKLAINIYKALPSKIKEALSDAIDFPDLSGISDYLPDYDFDSKNKFLAVTLLNKKTTDNSGNAEGKASITIQLLIFLGEREKEDEENKDDDAKNKTDGAENAEKGSEGKKEKEKGIYVLPVVKGDFGVNFNIGQKHYMSFTTNASLNGDVKAPGSGDKGKAAEADKAKSAENGQPKTEGGEKKDETPKNLLGCFIKYTEKISETDITWLTDEGSFASRLDVKFARGHVEKNEKNENVLKENTDPVSIFDTDIASLSIVNYPQTFFTGYDKDGFDIGYICELKKLLLALKLKDQNDFFKTILKNDIEIELEKLKLQYSYQKGFEVEDALHVRIPINADIDLDVVKFKNLTIDLGLDGNKLQSSVLTSFIADLKGVSITFTDMGLGIECKLPFNGQKEFDFSPKFTYPNGLGISIDVEGVKGGGVVQWDKERGRFFGGLELTVMEKFGAEAMLVFTTGTGTDPFSCMAALCVYFDPGIQLGMGFSLEGVGGSFGVNRMLSTDGLRDAVYDGTLESALFCKNVTKNVDKVLANIDKIYPIKTGQIYFGFLGKIAWGTILKADFGLFIQAPNPVTIIVAGIVKVSVAESVEKLLVINASFMGGIQFDKGIFFDASLYDSKIVGLELHGDMALRIYWGGETKGFILSIGGFHPQYKPESGFNLPDLKRVGLKLDYKIIKFSLDAYFAITSNTVQFGTSLDMRIGWDKFGLTGYAAFNALFQFNPFKFVVDMKAGLAVKVGSKKICSIDLAFELGGPAPWHAKGKASFWLLFIKISVHFDHTWGKKQVASDRKRIDILPIFTKELSQKSNWRFISSDLTDNMVSLVKFDEKSFVLQPSDTISFNQSAVPLDTQIECYGEDDVNDYEKISIASISIGSGSILKDNIEDEKSSFAPSLINNLDEDQKLSQPSFVSKTGGFKLTAGFDENKGSPCDKKIGYEAEYSISKDTEDYNASLKRWNAISKTLQNESTGTTKTVMTSKRMSSSNSKFAKVTRGSSRRTASGFNRFVNQLDEYWCNQIKNISKV